MKPQARALLQLRTTAPISLILWIRALELVLGADMNLFLSELETSWPTCYRPRARA